MGLPKPYLKHTIEGEWDIGVSWGPEDSHQCSHKLFEMISILRVF